METLFLNDIPINVFIDYFNNQHLFSDDGINKPYYIENSDWNSIIFNASNSIFSSIDKFIEDIENNIQVNSVTKRKTEYSYSQIKLSDIGQISFTNDINDEETIKNIDSGEIVKALNPKSGTKDSQTFLFKNIIILKTNDNQYYLKIQNVKEQASLNGKPIYIDKYGQLTYNYSYANTAESHRNLMKEIRNDILKESKYPEGSIFLTKYQNKTYLSKNVDGEVVRIHAIEDYPCFSVYSDAENNFNINSKFSAKENITLDNLSNNGEEQQYVNLKLYKRYTSIYGKKQEIPISENNTINVSFNINDVQINNILPNIENEYVETVLYNLNTTPYFIFTIPKESISNAKSISLGIKTNNKPIILNGNIEISNGSIYANFGTFKSEIIPIFNISKTNNQITTKNIIKKKYQKISINDDLMALDGNPPTLISKLEATSVNQQQYYIKIVLNPVEEELVKNVLCSIKSEMTLKYFKINEFGPFNNIEINKYSVLEKFPDLETITLDDFECNYIDLKGQFIPNGEFFKTRKELLLNTIEDILNDNETEIDILKLKNKTTGRVEIYNYCKGLDSFIKREYETKNNHIFNKRTLNTIDNITFNLVLEQQNYNEPKPIQNEELIEIGDRPLFQRIAQYKNYPLNFMYKKQSYNNEDATYINKPSDVFYTASIINKAKYKYPVEDIKNSVINTILLYYKTPNEKNAQLYLQNIDSELNTDYYRTFYSPKINALENSYEPNDTATTKKEVFWEDSNVDEILTKLLVVEGNETTKIKWEVL